MPDEEMTPEGHASEQSPEQPATPQEPAETPREPNVTPGGYEYELVAEGGEPPPPPPRARRTFPRGLRRPLMMLGLAAVPAAIVGVAVWFAAGSDGGGGERVNADVGNVINAFSQAPSGYIDRYEGSLPDDFPDVPRYPGAEVVSALVQESGPDLVYLAVFDTNDDRADVASYFDEQFDTDPWQVEAVQDNRDVTLHRFSRIDDPDVQGLVLVAESKDQGVTTLIYSVQITSGADRHNAPAFVVGDGRTIPDGFPQEVPSYPDATLIETGVQNEPATRSFALSFVTQDAISDVLDFYRDELANAGMSVQSGDASASGLEDAEAVQFADDAGNLLGQVTAGRFAADDAFTRVDLVVRQSTR